MRKPARLPLEELRPYLVEATPPGTPPDQVIPLPRLDWRATFGNEGPVELEVGFGKGLFLVTAGQANPGVNYLGVEIVRKYVLLTTTRLARRGLGNVKVACADARAFLRDRVVDGSVQAVHVYFPDPWWKARHHKRRVFTDEFARSCERVLRPGGRLLVATDVEDYAAMVRETAAAHTALRELPPPAEHAPEHDMDYLTNFERKFRRQGKPIWRMAYEKG